MFCNNVSSSTVFFLLLFSLKGGKTGGPIVAVFIPNCH